MLKNNNYNLKEKDLKSIESIVDSKKFHIALKKINKDFKDFGKFINAYEYHVNKKMLNVSKNINSFEDKIFESIISRLEYLNNYKKLSTMIFLQAQKNNNYFLILSKYLNEYFSTYSNNIINKAVMFSLYTISFNIWIEDNEELDKTMSFLGNSLDYLKKIKPFLNK